MLRKGCDLQKRMCFAEEHRICVRNLTLHINVTVLLDEKKRIYIRSLKQSNL